LQQPPHLLFVVKRKEDSIYGIELNNKMLCLRFGRGHYSQHVLTSSRLVLHQRPLFVSFSGASYTPMTKEEEEAEKARVEKLSAYQKEMELRDIDRQIAKLSMLRGINTGELYTFRGKYKALARDYGFPFMGWYWCCWSASFGLCYSSIQLGLIDAASILNKVDEFTGYNIVAHVDPTLGAIGLALVLNEVLEPIRLPIVVMTTKPVVHWLGLGPKY
jgi:hypothetical protein